MRWASLGFDAVIPLDFVITMPPNRHVFVLLEFRDGNGEFAYRAFISALPGLERDDFVGQVYDHVGYVPPAIGMDNGAAAFPEGKLFSVTVRSTRQPQPQPTAEAVYFITGPHGVHRFGAVVPYRQEDVVGLLADGQQVREVPFVML